MFTFPVGFFGGSTGAGDPYWNNVVFLHNFQGVNGSKPIIDQSKYAHSIFWGGTAQIVAPSVFPSLSSHLALAGGNNYISIANSSVFGFGTGDFTFEAYIYLTGYLVNNNGYFNGQLWNKDNFYSRDYLWTLNGTASSYTGFTFARLFGTSVAVTFAFQLNTPYFISATRKAGILYMHCNGQLLNPGGSSFPDNLPVGSSNPQIGRTDYGSPYFYNIPGNIAAFRVTNIGRYQNADYTIPVLPHSVS